MRVKPTTGAVLAVAAAATLTLVAVAAGGPIATKQRIAIEHGTGSSFHLTPLTPGAVKPDTGTATFCCWTERHVVRNGEAVDLDNPQMTLTGKLGTLVARNVIGYVDVPGGWAVFTGTWKLVRGTGQYAGLAGGGRGAGISSPGGATKARFEGFLSTR